MQVSELKADSTTDALVALAQGWEQRPTTGQFTWYTKEGYQAIPVKSYQPSTNGAQAFELIEKFIVNIKSLPIEDNERIWVAHCICHDSEVGSTPTLAICKAVIASKWGDEVPDAVMEKLLSQHNTDSKGE